MYKVDIIADSVSPLGNRLTTFQLTYPRVAVHEEFLTHRMLSRNAQSSRAIPIEKMIKQVEEDPFIPVHWGRKQKGMVAEEEVSLVNKEIAESIWCVVQDWAVLNAKMLVKLGVHKQVVNRLLEPFSWITVIATATDWPHFFDLRCSEGAQPEMRKLANMMREEYNVQHKPHLLAPGEWHLPYILSEEQTGFLDPVILPRISAARCARVSYLTHEGKRDVEKDLALADRLEQDLHLSPFEHAATPTMADSYEANFLGWRSLRKEMEEMEHYRRMGK